MIKLKRPKSQIMHQKLLTVLILFTVSAVQAQSKWGWDVAAAGIYGKNLETIGPQVRAYFLVNEHICFGPEFGWLNATYTDASGHRSSVDLYEWNVNAHYVFEVGHQFGIYPLAGLNWTIEQEAELTQKEFGINVGTGFHVFANRWVPFVEYSYLMGQLSDHKVILGTYFIIKDIEKKKH